MSSVARSSRPRAAALALPLLLAVASCALVVRPAGAGFAPDARVDAPPSPPPDRQPTPDAPAIDQGMVDTPSPPIDVPPSTRDTYTYVISSLSIDPTDDLGTPHTGFNLDERCSTGDDPAGCLFDDFASALDRDQNTPPGCAPGSGACRGCVDNRLPSLVATLGTMADYRAALAAQIASGRVAYVVQLTSVDDLVNDAAVLVTVFDAFPAFSTDCTGVRPDREYVVARRSLAGGGFSLGQARFRVTGRIVGGRLEMAATNEVAFALPPLTIGSGPIVTTPILLRSPRLRADLTPAEGARGNLGGRASASELVMSLCAAAPMYCALVRSVIGNLVDLAPTPPLPGGLCFDPATARAGDIGMGLGFTMVRARLRERDTIVDARPAGACGG